MTNVFVKNACVGIVILLEKCTPSCLPYFCFIRNFVYWEYENLEQDNFGFMVGDGV